MSIFGDFGSFITQAPDVEQGGSWRLLIWGYALKLIKESPFIGYGPDTFGIQMEQFSEEINRMFHLNIYFDKVHIDYLQIAVTSGIPALLVYLSFVFSVMKKSYKLIWQSQFSLFLFASVFGYLIAIFFNISVVCVAYIYWILLGALANSVDNAEKVVATKLNT